VPMPRQETSISSLSRELFVSYANHALRIISIAKIRRELGVECTREVVSTAARLVHAGRDKSQ
jgi:hypothetical protein